MLRLPNLKPGVEARRHDLVHPHVRHLRSRRPLVQSPLKARHGLSLAFRHHFNRSVGVIGDVATQAFAARRVPGIKPEPDALDVTAHQEPPGDAHPIILAQPARLRGDRGRTAAPIHYNIWA